MTKTILLANDLFAKLDGFDPADVLAQIQPASTVLEAAQTLGLIAVLPEVQQPYMTAFLDSIPPAVDAAVMAAVRSALARGLRVQISWQPGYDFELRVWEVSEGSTGMVNVHLVSPHPAEATPEV